MTSIATVTGKVIDYLNPDPAQICLDDLAHGLSRQPRYCGQTIRPYSVAQHSLLVAWMAPEEHRLAALLHDGPEAYICDLPSPLKEAMAAIADEKKHRSPYAVIEQRLHLAICARFDLARSLHPRVIEADYAAMCVEAPMLQPRGWATPLWDRHRRQLVRPGAGEELRRLLGLDDGGRYAWVMAFGEEMAKRIDSA